VNELSAVLAYDLALVDFEALQEAGPAGVVGAIASAAQTPPPSATAAATAAAAAARPATMTTGIPVF
jgi:hypothetical protein